MNLTVVYLLSFCGIVYAKTFHFKGFHYLKVCLFVYFLFLLLILISLETCCPDGQLDNLVASQRSKR